MPKRGQEGTSQESSAIAKPRSTNLAMSTPRPGNLVPYNMLSVKKDSPQDMSDSDNPEDAKAEQGGCFNMRVEKDEKHKPVPIRALSRERQQENTQN